MMFAEMVAQEIRNRGYECEVSECYKNGRKYPMVVIRNGKVSPAVAIRKNMGNDPVKLADEIIKNFTNDDGGERYLGTIDVITNWNEARKMIRPCLQKLPGKGEIYKPFLDMVSVYRLFIDEGASVRVTKELMAKWGKTVDDVHEAAMYNLEDDIVIRNLSDFMTGNGYKDIPRNPYFLVLTNKSSMYGASAIMNEETLHGIAEDFRSDLFIIPSSIHECLILRAEKGWDKQDFNDMVTSVNTSVLGEDEVLNSHIYTYSRETRTLA